MRTTSDSQNSVIPALSAKPGIADRRDDLRRAISEGAASLKLTAPGAGNVCGAAVIG